MEHFVRDLDTLLTESPRSLDRYSALLAWYFPDRQPSPLRSNFYVLGCDANQVIEIARRSKFLYEIGKPPNYQHYRIEFRGRLAKIYLSIDRDTGAIFGTGAWWIKSYL
jgi:hypothetical protein